MRIKFANVFVVAMIAIGLISCKSKETEKKKPVIYLYPTEKQKIDIKIKYRGELTVTYPDYKNGWNVTAFPEGKIINLSDNKEYSYLFWEGSDKLAKYDLTTGFIVKGSETANFLQKKLAEIGLTPKEYNEFIVYWLPQMLNNNYNLIHFASKQEYDDIAVLDINPKPISVLRVFMVFKKLDKVIQIKPQKTNPFIRKGFTVVEWGGCEINE